MCEESEPIEDLEKPEPIEDYEELEPIKDYDAIVALMKELNCPKEAIDYIKKANYSYQEGHYIALGMSLLKFEHHGREYSVTASRKSRHLFYSDGDVDYEDISHECDLSFMVHYAGGAKSFRPYYHQEEGVTLKTLKYLKKLLNDLYTVYIIWQTDESEPCTEIYLVESLSRIDEICHRYASRYLGFETEDFEPKYEVKVYPPGKQECFDSSELLLNAIKAQRNKIGSRLGRFINRILGK
jgi:hypothetical protein